MGEYKEATLYRMEELKSTCPPKHVNTDAFTLIPQETGVKGFVLFCTEVHPGGEAQPDIHAGREHCYFILSGVGDAVVNGKSFRCRPGDVLWIPPDAEHGIKPVGGQTLRFAVVTSPAPWVPVSK